MREYKKKLNQIGFLVIIFTFAFFLRLHFFSGFILCDDIQEFSAAQYILVNGPNLFDQFHLRFGVWIFNVLFFKFFGISEFSFFLPTLLMSSTFSILGYCILVHYKYPKFYAFLAGLFIASAPYEVLIGTLRANDVIFSWLIALGFFSLIFFKKRSILQGILVAFFLWFAFYTKLWAVYFLPALSIYYFFQFKNKKFCGGISFFITSLILFGITSIVWKIKLGDFLPFISSHAATYPVPKDAIMQLFQIYPTMIFRGSEFGTTLFGYVPYLLILLLITKFFLLKLSKKFSKFIRFDELDIYLFVFYVSFFLLLNFFPNTFKFDQYYSVPRIFRYLTPISFPITLHLSKLIIDFAFLFSKVWKFMEKYWIVTLFFLLILLNIHQADEATRPGQVYRRTLFSVIEDIKKLSPPQLLVESWISFFIRELYLKETNISIPFIFDIYNAKEYEKWLNEKQSTLPDGTAMITGIGSCLHYGCHNCGFRLKLFYNNLDPRWKLFREYGVLDYLPYPEPVRLWIWSSQNITDQFLTIKIV